MQWGYVISLIIQWDNDGYVWFHKFSPVGCWLVTSKPSLDHEATMRRIVRDIGNIKPLFTGPVCTPHPPAPPSSPPASTPHHREPSPAATQRPASPARTPRVLASCKHRRDHLGQAASIDLMALGIRMCIPGIYPS